MVLISDKEFEQLAGYIKTHYGINLKSEKKYLIVGRLQSVLAEKGIKSYADYYKYLMTDSTGEAVQTLVTKLTTNHTYFMRENEHFSYFASHVLPQLVSNQTSQRDLRIWSAGCSTGEEPYTLAMVIADYFGQQKRMWDTRILATDLSPKVIKAASQGIYTNDHLASVPERWKNSYFKPLNHELAVVKDEIKKEVIFRRFNLMSTFPFKKRFNVIFCRNVMIYFDSKARKDLIRRFYEVMEPGGYLFIGHSESISREESGYNYVRPAVYRKD